MLGGKLAIDKHLIQEGGGVVITQLLHAKETQISSSLLFHSLHQQE